MQQKAHAAVAAVAAAHIALNGTTEQQKEPLSPPTARKQQQKAPPFAAAPFSRNSAMVQGRSVLWLVRRGARANLIRRGFLLWVVCRRSSNTHGGRKTSGRLDRSIDRSANRCCRLVDDRYGHPVTLDRTIRQDHGPIAACFELEATNVWTPTTTRPKAALTAVTSISSISGVDAG
jgi:hypothetical protein